MLSRVAENVYWMARYLERAEDTARLVIASTHLLLDLPRYVPLSWGSMVEILGASLPRELEEAPDERGVMRFLITDASHPGSLVSAVRMAREDARVSRDMLPAEVWEAINSLHIHVKENAAQAQGRAKRLEFLREVVLRCQQINGVIDGTVSRGELYRFLALGQQLERADMTTRIVDVRAARLLPGDSELLRPYIGVVWMSVLKSLSGYEMYRHQVQSRIRGPEVVRFLLKDPCFPRAVERCLARLAEMLEDLPNGERALECVGLARQRVRSARLEPLDLAGMHRLIDDVQCDLCNVHAAIADACFRYGGPLPQQQILAQSA